MPTVKCGEPGCNREFTHKDPITLKRMIGYHKASIHSIPGATRRDQLVVKEGGSYKCRYCGEPFKQLQSLGSHVRLKHQAELKEKKAQAQKRVLTDEQAAHRREYQRKYRESHRMIAVPLNADEQSHRASLQKSAWWKVESEQNKRQVWCPCCGAQFAILEGSK